MQCIPNVFCRKVSIYKLLYAFIKVWQSTCTCGAATYKENNDLAPVGHMLGCYVASTVLPGLILQAQLEPPRRETGAHHMPASLKKKNEHAGIGHRKEPPPPHHLICRPSRIAPSCRSISFASARPSLLLRNTAVRTRQRHGAQPRTTHLPSTPDKSATAACAVRPL